MATKKQKREAAIAKREAFLAQVKEEGMEAQRLDRTIQAKQRERYVEVAREINAKHRAILSREENRIALAEHDAEVEVGKMR